MFVFGVSVFVFMMQICVQRMLKVMFGGVSFGGGFGGVGGVGGVVGGVGGVVELVWFWFFSIQGVVLEVGDVVVFFVCVLFIFEKVLGVFYFKDKVFGKWGVYFGRGREILWSCFFLFYV